MFFLFERWDKGIVFLCLLFHEIAAKFSRIILQSTTIITIIIVFPHNFAIYYYYYHYYNEQKIGKCAPKVDKVCLVYF